MRIHYGSMSLPKKAAKRVQKIFSSFMPLHQAQHMTALMLGYDNWHTLEQKTKHQTNLPSLLDELASSELQEQRLSHQIKILGSFLPYTEPWLRERALAVRVSAGNPKSEDLAFDGYRRNSLIHWQCYGEGPEWKFCPSLRTKESRDQLDDLQEEWLNQKLNLGEYQSKLEQLMKKEPENIAAYLHMLSAIEDIDVWSLATKYTDKLALACIPGKYPMKRKVDPFNWGTIDNRDYLRAIYYLVFGFYATKDYKKSKRWFLFLTRCSPMEIGLEKLFLKDLRQPIPNGNIHKEIKSARNN